MLKDSYKKKFEKDESNEFRTTVIQERLEAIYPHIVIGALGYHSPFDFIVERIEKLTKKEAGDYFLNSEWGETWRLGS